MLGMNFASGRKYWVILRTTGFFLTNTYYVCLTGWHNRLVLVVGITDWFWWDPRFIPLMKYGF